MAPPLQRLIYGATQRARSAWYSAHYAAAMRLAPKIDPPPSGALPGWSAIYQDLQELLARDWRNVQSGLYPAPPVAMSDLAAGAQQSLAFFRDLNAVNQRRSDGNGSEIFQLPLKGKYPRYYLQNFHYQSGGYLTAESAELYDHQVEVLFVGGADAMRRQALAALARHSRDAGVLPDLHLDVACGTGRFLRMLKDARPRLRVAGIDLSLPYLGEARRNLKAWSRSHVTQANAEQLPIADHSVSSVSCIFLFHELPKKVRQTVANEIARVLKPGGRLFFMDSIQLGDHSAYDVLLERFPLAFHEPYYIDFIGSDLPSLFKAAGLSIVTSERVFFAKLLVLEKPRHGASTAPEEDDLT